MPKKGALKRAIFYWICFFRFGVINFASKESYGIIYDQKD